MPGPEQRPAVGLEVGGPSQLQNLFWIMGLGFTGQCELGDTHTIQLMSGCGQAERGRKQSRKEAWGRLGN